MSLTGWALLGQGALLTLSTHPEGCIPCVALGSLLIAGVEKAVLWTKIVAVVAAVGCPLLAWHDSNPTPVLLDLMAGFCLWQLNEQNNDRLRVACIALGCYYCAYISIVLVLPHS
jgi:hypothetical protein